MSEMTIERFYENLLEEISMASEAETYGWEAQDFFTAVVLEYLEESGEVDSPVICPFRGYVPCRRDLVLKKQKSEQKYMALKSFGLCLQMG